MVNQVVEAKIYRQKEEKSSEEEEKSSEEEEKSSEEEEKSSEEEEKSSEEEEKSSEEEEKSSEEEEKSSEEEEKSSEEEEKSSEEEEKSSEEEEKSSEEEEKSSEEEEKSVNEDRVGEWSKKYANLPDRYIRRTMEQIYWRNPKGIQYRPNVVVKRKKFHFTLDRPWSGQFFETNSPGRFNPKVFVEPIKKWSFFKGDRVEILMGKDKGKQGIIKYVVQERNWVLVEGLNCKLRKLERDTVNIYIQEEKPLLVTDQVALVDPSDLKATDFEWRYTESGAEVRVSKRTGRIIPMPATAEETVDYKTRGTYQEQPKDTVEKDLGEITFEPSLKTFEMDVMDKMGIKEDRVCKKSYWY
ncbi:hypothetical protein FQA39_LY03364 [Lamprigera yunnana]|nr:hypothetical protein FQA39_LY03364 [Lamprigera yunnana]